jgi:hypothetical protein
MAYAIEWSGNAASSRKLYLANFPRFDQALLGLEWSLARKPYLCPKIKGCSLRCITIGPFIVEKEGVFAVKAFFRIIATNQVSIDWLEASLIGDQVTEADSSNQDVI